jgi:hypothetical protein
MNRFIRKMCGIILILTGIFISLFIFFNYISNKQFDTYKLNLTDSILFGGDSHLRVAINDNALGCSVNLSQNGEAYLFTYYKLRRLLDNNSKLKKIYLGFSYHNFSGFYDDVTYGDRSWYISSRYFFVLPISEKMKLLKCNFYCLFLYFKRIFQYAINNTFNSNKENSFLGSYEIPDSDRSVTPESINRRVESQYFKKNKEYDFATINLLYLKKIIELCKSKRVDLTLVNSPLHPYYISKVPKNYQEEYKSFIKENSLHVLDLSNFFSDDSCFMPDGDHVSKKGSFLITAYFNSHR